LKTFPQVVSSETVFVTRATIAGHDNQGTMNITRTAAETVQAACLASNNEQASEQNKHLHCFAHVGLSYNAALHTSASGPNHPHQIDCPPLLAAASSTPSPQPENSKVLR
jgi:hypothetical protein